MPGTQQDIVPQHLPLHGPGQHPPSASSDRIEPTMAEPTTVSRPTAGMEADATSVTTTAAVTVRTTGGAGATAAVPA